MTTSPIIISDCKKTIARAFNFLQGRNAGDSQGRDDQLFIDPESFVAYIAATAGEDPVITAHNDQDDTWNVILDLGGYSDQEGARDVAERVARALAPLLTLAATAAAFGADDPRAKWISARRQLVIAEEAMFHHLRACRDTPDGQVPTRRLRAADESA